MHFLVIWIVVADQVMSEVLHDPDGIGFDHGGQVKYSGDPLVKGVYLLEDRRLLPVMFKLREQGVYRF